MQEIKVFKSRKPTGTNNIITINDPKFKEPISYRMEPRLKATIDNKFIPATRIKDEDVVLAIDGGEGSGKSTLTFQIAKYIDPSFNLSRVVFDAEAFKEAVFKAQKGQCIVYDEAFTGLSSRSSLSGINRALVSLMMQMRQKNLVILVVLPTFFLLDKYVALFRTRALIHVFKSKGRRGYFKVYNRRKKKQLYLIGKQTYSYFPKIVRTRFKGKFPGVFALGDVEEDRKYRIKKAKALEDTQSTPMSAGQIKYKDQRDVAIFLIRKLTRKSYQDIEEMFLEYQIDISFQQISVICKKFGDTEKKLKIIYKKEKIKERKGKKGKDNVEIEEIEEESDDIYAEDDGEEPLLSGDDTEIDDKSVENT